MTALDPVYRFQMRVVHADDSGYYHPRWDRALSVTSIAATKGEATRKVADMLGEPPRGRGWSWRFQIDEIEEVTMLAPDHQCTPNPYKETPDE